MKVFWCYYKTDDEWGCYVIAPTHNKAKSLFHEWYLRDIGGWDDYTDIRCFKKMVIAEGLGLEPQVLDDPDDPLLKELGLRYITYEEYEELYGW